MARRNLIAASIPDKCRFEYFRFLVYLNGRNRQSPCDHSFRPSRYPKIGSETLEKAFLRNARLDEIVLRSRGAVRGTHEVRLVSIHADHALRQPQGEGVEVHSVSWVGRCLLP